MPTQTETIGFLGVDFQVLPGSFITFYGIQENSQVNLGTVQTGSDQFFSFSTDVPVASWLEFLVVDNSNVDAPFAVAPNTQTTNGSILVENFVTLDGSASDAGDPISAPVTKNQTVTPFAHATVSDGDPNATIQVMITQSTGYVSSNNLTFSGNATQVQAYLDGFTAKALQNGPGQITALLSGGVASSSAGAGGGKVFASLTFNGTAPGGSGLQSPSTAQITTLTNDTIKFYNDGGGSADDASQLASDLSGLSLTKSNLAQLLAAALQKDAGGNAGTLANDLTNVFYGSINSDLHSQSANLRGDLTSMIQETVAVGGTYAADLLAPGGSASQALAQTIAQYHLA